MVPLRFRIKGFMICDRNFVYNIMFRVSGVGCRVGELGFKDSAFGFQDYVIEFRVQGAGFRV